MTEEAAEIKHRELDPMIMGPKKSESAIRRSEDVRSSSNPSSKAEEGCSHHRGSQKNQPALPQPSIPGSPSVSSLDEPPTPNSLWIQMLSSTGTSLLAQPEGVVESLGI